MAKRISGTGGHTPSPGVPVGAPSSPATRAAPPAHASQVADGVLHDIANVLNTVAVSAGLLRQLLGPGPLGKLADLVARMNEAGHPLQQLADASEDGRRLRTYLAELASAQRNQWESAQQDIDRLVRSVEHILYVIASRQPAATSGIIENHHPAHVVEEALRVTAGSLAKRQVRVVREFADVPAALFDQHRLLQILVNLIDNAARAMEQVPVEHRVVTLVVELVKGDGSQPGGQHIRFAVRDMGEGIAPENLPRLFSHGFTTRPGGHGFGLHSSAAAAAEMGGRIVAASEGAGCGATFSVELPLRRAADE